jgi:hypothetical protein
MATMLLIGMTCHVIVSLLFSYIGLPDNSVWIIQPVTSTIGRGKQLHDMSSQLKALSPLFVLIRFMLLSVLLLNEIFPH